MSVRPLPLADVRILAVEQYGAGPFGSMLLADLGATIIKIEDPGSGGDVGRYVPPFQKDETSLFFEALNRTKHSISIDLQREAGQEAFRSLVPHVDAVYSNLRGDVPERLRLTYAHLSGVNPSIVCCSLSAFGMEGSHRAEPGYDYLLQGLAGWMSLTGEPDGPPAKSGLSLVDFSASYAAALALMAGIHSARRDGVGLDCDIALFDIAVGMLNYLGTWHLTGGYEPRRTAASAHPSLTPFQNFRTADGWIVVACAKEKFWRRLTDALRCAELREDPRFSGFAERSANADVLIPLLADRIADQPSAAVLDRLQDAGVPCAPVLSVPEALQQPSITERGMIVTYPHPVFGQVRTIGSPVKVGRRTRDPQPAPRLGEHTQETLRTLGGLSTAAILELRRRGAFGSDDGSAATPAASAGSVGEVATASARGDDDQPAESDDEAGQI